MNLLKPKSTARNEKALVYKRFIGLEKSINLQTIYRTGATAGNYKYWTFDNLKLEFTELSADLVPNSSNIVAVPNSTTVLQYLDNYFNYTGSAWQKITNLSSQGITLLSATFNNIAQYQMNKYYYVGSFDYMIKGSIEGSTSQYIKGNIVPLTSMNIRYFDDIELNVDDLVVVGGRLYSVENPETSLKQMPKPFKIHFAILNSIL